MGSIAWAQNDRPNFCSDGPTRFSWTKKTCRSRQKEAVRSRQRLRPITIIAASDISRPLWYDVETKYYYRPETLSWLLYWRSSSFFSIPCVEVNRHLRSDSRAGSRCWQVSSAPLHSRCVAEALRSRWILVSVPVRVFCAPCQTSKGVVVHRCMIVSSSFL